MLRNEVTKLVGAGRNLCEPIEDQTLADPAPDAFRSILAQNTIATLRQRLSPRQNEVLSRWITIR